MYQTIQSRLVGVFLVLSALFGLSCDQYEYASPTPGILEVRLAVKNNVNAEYIPFGSLDSTTGSQNNFFLQLKKLEVFQQGGIRQEIFSSLVAIQRNVDGDLYNCLDLGARDSTVLLGIAYAPPGQFDEFIFTNSIIQQIFINTRPVTTTFDVDLISPFENRGNLRFSGTVREGRTTRVTITCDLDRSLRRRAEDFSYSPYFYVSSVQEF